MISVIIVNCNMYIQNVYGKIIIKKYDKNNRFLYNDFPGLPADQTALRSHLCNLHFL